MPHAYPLHAGHISTPCHAPLNELDWQHSTQGWCSTGLWWQHEGVTPTMSFHHPQWRLLVTHVGYHTCVIHCSRWLVNSMIVPAGFWTWVIKGRQGFPLCSYLIFPPLILFTPLMCYVLVYSLSALCLYPPCSSIWESLYDSMLISISPTPYPSSLLNIILHTMLPVIT